ncbi:hypothetical protein ACOME3_006726 [Neoechinorhynchus agilis]
MNGERESDTETLKDSLIEVMSTVKDILTEALKNEQLIEVKKCKGKKADGLPKLDSQATTKENKVLVDSISMLNSNEDLLETNDVLKTENIAIFTRDLVPPLEDIQPVVFNDSEITVESDIVTGIKGNDKKESDPAEVITEKATVQQKVEETSERPSIHFGKDTPSPPPLSSLVALNSTHRIMHSSLDDRNRTIFTSGMPEAPATDPVVADAHNIHQILRIGQLLFPDIHSTIPPPLTVMRIPPKNSFNPGPRLLKVTFISPFVASSFITGDTNSSILFSYLSTKERITKSSHLHSKLNPELILPM